MKKSQFIAGQMFSIGTEGKTLYYDAENEAICFKDGQWHCAVISQSMCSFIVQFSHNINPASQTIKYSQLIPVQ